MRNAECQAAAAVVADHFTPAAASGPARLLDSGQVVLRVFAQPRADSDQAPGLAPLVRGLPAFHLLRHRIGHFHREAFHRGPLYPADMCS
jgi:hypothetical protein